MRQHISRKELSRKMIHSMRFAIALAASSAVLAASDASSQGRGPRVSVAQETFDFGFVPQKATVSHVFWLRNTGDETLLIEKMIPNCGCTQVPLETNKARPGDSIRVEMLFASGYFAGPLSKYTQIVSNASGRVPPLTFTAHVFADTLPGGPLRAEPPLLDLDLARPVSTDSQWTARVKVRNTTSDPLDITLVDLPDQDVRVSVSEGILAPGESREIVFHFRSDIEDQVFAKSVTLSVGGPEPTRMTIPVFKTLRWGPRLLKSPGTAAAGP